jgi:tetraprenyl-beta-curcumene synthase
MFTLHVARRGRVRVVATFAWSMLLYWLAIFPRASRELARWRSRAASIPDPELRRHALTKLEDEHLSAEGAAAFAILADRRHRHHLVRICVAFEVMYDYLDAVSEATPTLDNNRQLHRALSAAFSIDPVELDYYAHSEADDGGYLAELVEACRASLGDLPSRVAVVPALLRAATRAAEAQSLNHAGGHDGHRMLAAWARTQPSSELGFHWWETAAAAGSPLAIYALLAAACAATTTASQADAIERAYFPWVAALEWLLESAVDRADDLVTGNHSYVAHYASSTEAIERLGAIAEHATADVRRLPQTVRHRLLLAGMVGMHLSRCDGSHAVRDVTRVTHAAVGTIVSPFLVVLRVRRSMKRLRRRRGPLGITPARQQGDGPCPVAPPSPTAPRRRRGGGRR